MANNRYSVSTINGRVQSEHLRDAKAIAKADSIARKRRGDAHPVSAVYETVNYGDGVSCVAAYCAGAVIPEHEVARNF